MRTANLILHRKVDSKAECICGSKMDYIDGKGHCCKRQMRILAEKFLEDTITS